MHYRKRLILLSVLLINLQNFNELESMCLEPHKISIYDNSCKHKITIFFIFHVDSASIGLFKLFGSHH